jgi:ankyrin repeat protein
MQKSYGVYFLAFVFCSSHMCAMETGSRPRYENKNDQNQIDSMFKYAAAGDHVNVKQLLDAGVDPNCVNNAHFSPLFLATVKGSIETVQALLHANADTEFISASEYTPLHVAASWGYVEIVQLLVDAGANIYAQNNEKQTALQIASKEGHAKIVKILLKERMKQNKEKRKSITSKTV